MKKWIVAAIVLAAVLLVAPTGLGKLAEKRVNAGLDKLVEATPYLVIAERSWEGGWFKSRQKVTFELAPTFRGMMDDAVMQAAIGQVVAEAMGVAPEAHTEEQAVEDAPAPDESAVSPADVIPERFVVHNDVLHGPVLGLSGLGVARLKTSFDLPPEVVQGIREIFGEEPAATLTTRLGLLGGATTVLASRGRTLKLGEQGDITYADLRFVTKYDGDLDDYSFDGGLPSVEIESQDGASAVLTRLTFEGSAQRVLGDLYDMDAALELKEMKGTGASGRRFAIQDVHYRTTAASDDGFTRIGIELGSGDVDVAEITATGLDIEGIYYDFSFRRLHTETLAKIMTAMKQFYAAPAGDEPAALASVFSENLLGPLKEHGAALLTHDPEFAFDRVGVMTTDGEGVIKGVVKLIGVTADDLSLTAWDRLLAKVDAQFTVEVAQPLAEKLPNGAMMSGMALDTGYATREGDKLVSRLEFRANTLTINGKPLPLPGMGGMPGPQPELTPVDEEDAPAALEL